MIFGDKTAKEVVPENKPRDVEKIFPQTAPVNREPAPVAAITSIPARTLKESVLSADLTIEGKIEGAGHVRIASRFKGDVHVQGNVTIEQGAVVTGEVKADIVIIAGQLDGNVDATTRVELLATGLLNGDLKAGSLTVAAGSRMRGRAEFGWTDNPVKHAS
ncbi:MAG: polymer-forming cytoskeletal protein [Steroidobacteraceae bacterium]